jgi:hypothetical protein
VEIVRDSSSKEKTTIADLSLMKMNEKMQLRVAIMMSAMVRLSR